MADYRVPPLNAGERLYRVLLHLYPSRFRRAFDRDLIEAFRDQRRDAIRRRMPAFVFALAVTYDVLTQALAERASSVWSTLRNRQSPLELGSVPQAVVDAGNLRIQGQALGVLPCSFGNQQELTVSPYQRFGARKYGCVCHSSASPLGWR